MTEERSEFDQVFDRLRYRYRAAWRKIYEHRREKGRRSVHQPRAVREGDQE